MDTVQVEVELPRAVLSSLRADPDEFVRQMREAAVAKWYEMGILSQAKAAQVAGVSRADFLALLTQYGVSPFQATAAELIEETAMSERWIVNASPLIVLCKVGLQWLLHRLTDVLGVPDAVADEVLVGPGRPRACCVRSGSVHNRSVRPGG